jgi:NhaP-type Na+/H+ or K+/H+ antiporter
LIRKVRVRDPSPPWQWVFVISFAGVRGAVSLAAALALPFALAGGEPFPYRDLILFVTFSVIFITLVGLGLTLPALVRWLGLTRAGHAEQLDRSMASATIANYRAKWFACCARDTKPARASCRTHWTPMREKFLQPEAS